MAKRKRLTAPNPDGIRAPESKSLASAPMGVIPPRRAPIADVAGDAATIGALQAVAAEMTAAKTQGRIVQALPLDDVDPNYLIRDRVTLDDEEMEILKTSLSTRGQQTPIEVVENDQGRYGLISGFRRLHALRELSKDAEAAQTVLALVRQPGEASASYTAMVEENEIRVGLSYFERANIVIRAVQAGVFPSETAALKDLFASASRAKRSKIKSFLPLVQGLGSYLKFPSAITERQGLALAAEMAQDPGFAPRLSDVLRKAGAENAEAEMGLINRALTRVKGEISAPQTPALPAKGNMAKSHPPQVQAEVLPSGIKVENRPGELRLSGPALLPDVVDKVLIMLRNIP